MNFKVYKTYLEKWQPFVFYVHEGKFTPTSNVNNPSPPTNTFWIKDSNVYTKIGPIQTDRIACPVIKMKTEDINDYFIMNFPSLYQNCCEMVMGLNYYIHVIIKRWDDGTSEVGLCSWNGVGDLLDDELQTYVDRYIKLIVFS